MKAKILIINGPNLNMLKFRDNNIYGSIDLKQINKKIKKNFKNIKFIFFQSNSEEKIINKIQKSKKIIGIVINPAAYTHTSVAIRDALEIKNVIKVEVHLSDINNREEFRKINYIKDVVDKSIFGKKILGYFEAIQYIVEKKLKK